MLVEFYLYSSFILNSQDTPTKNAEQQEQRCAINFFGLPRAFDSLVLPSIVKNVIVPNPGCDYYVHYYHKTEEESGRSGSGGFIDPTAILHLKDAVLQEAQRRGTTPLPTVEFTFDTEEDFWKEYTPLIEKIRTTKVDGKYLYFPWKARTYKHPTTTDNIVKMWHSIQSSFHLMERNAAASGIEYTTVAMLRSDVLYVTPIDVHDAPGEQRGDHSEFREASHFGSHHLRTRRRGQNLGHGTFCPTGTARTVRAKERSRLGHAFGTLPAHLHLSGDSGSALQHSTAPHPLLFARSGRRQRVDQRLRWSAVHVGTFHCESTRRQRKHAQGGGANDWAILFGRNHQVDAYRSVTGLCCGQQQEGHSLRYGRNG